MADSIREQIVANLVAAVRQVTMAAGYEVDIKAVDRHRRTKYQRHEMPAVNVWEVSEKKSPGPSAQTTCFLSVGLEITVCDPANQAPLVNQALGAVLKAVLADRTRGGLAVDTEEGDNETFIGDESDPTGGIRLGIEIEYRHAENDPYASI